MSETDGPKKAKLDKKLLFQNQATNKLQELNNMIDSIDQYTGKTHFNVSPPVASNFGSVFSSAVNSVDDLQQPPTYYQNTPHSANSHQFSHQPTYCQGCNQLQQQIQSCKNLI